MRLLDACCGAALLAAALAGCDPGAVGCTDPARLPGLTPIAYRYVDAEEARYGHSRELVIDGDLLFIADSNGLPVLRWTGDELELVHPLTRERTHHCSTGAVHAASRTFVCASADTRLMTLEDVRDPEQPVSRPWSVERAPAELLSVRDVTIEGDVVWMATDLGLLRGSFDAGGDPALERTDAGVDPVQVQVAGDRLVMLDRALGLVVLDAATLEVLDTEALDGPPLDLAVDGDRLAVALGSEGARVFALEGGQASLTASVQPRCVATAADLEGDELAVGCLSGVTLYDLRASDPRVAGFTASRYGVLDLAFTDYGLVVVDWFRVDVYATDPDGDVLVPDAPRGMRLAAGADAHVPVRNPGDTPLELGWTLRRTAGGTVRSGALSLPAHGEAVVDLDAADLEAAGSLDGLADLVFHAPGGVGCAEPSTRIAHRRATDPPWQPGIGDPFPTLTRTAASDAPETLPVAGQESLVMFLTVDCFLQWPQLEDMAWAQDHDGGQPPPVVLFLTTMDEDPFDPSHFLVHFAAERLLTVEYADYYRTIDTSEPNPVRSFEQTFYLRLPGADFPHDYRLDASGTVTATSRSFRGRWPLGE